MRKLAHLFWILIIFVSFVMCGQETSEEKGKQMKDYKIEITLKETVKMTATMYDNPTTRDFLSLLPMTLNLKDYAATEKISQLPKKLSVMDAPKGSDPFVGAVTYYSPWGNLAIFYKDFGYADGLIILGKIDSDMSILKNCKDDCEVKIKLVN